MSNLIPMHFDGCNVRIIKDDLGEPWFVGKDVCEALGYADHINAMKQHCKGVVKRHPLHTAGGMQDVRVLPEPDVLRLIVSSTLPAAEKFERWVFEDVLPTIRRTGSFSMQGAAQSAEAFKLVPIVIRAARALGMDKNAAALSANQAITKLTGTNVMSLLGQTHLEAANQETRWHSPTELGKRINVSGRQFNMLLAEAGLQAKEGGEDWKPTPAAEGFFRLFDTSKRHGSGTPVQQLKWAENVLVLVQPQAA